VTHPLQPAHEAILAGRIDEAAAIIEANADGDAFTVQTLRAGLLMRQRKWTEALYHLEAAERERPYDFTVHFNRGLCFHNLGKFEDAIRANRQALKCNVFYAKSWMKLGAAHLCLHCWHEALGCYEHAVTLDPNDAECMLALGTGISLLGDDEAAVRVYRRALDINPDAFEAEVALGFCLLRLGRWDEGWDRFELRWKLHPHGAPWDWTREPPWMGHAEDLAGKRVLLHAEMGYGDTIHFCRYATMVADVAEAVYMIAQPPIARLMERLDPRVILRGENVAEPDVTVSLMSLPRAFRTTPETCPPPAKFAVEARKTPCRIGVCWHGGARPNDPAAHADDQRRSIPWELFQHVVEACGEMVMSLQEEDLKQHGVTDWLGTAEMIAGLDLVISVDTAALHLAASLGIETWGLMRFGGCWRWQSIGSTTPWYPTMRLFRQPALAEWAPVVLETVAALQEWKAKNPR
jgi:tetratricopeptide (TPR) repeat protein